ncbi:MAG TPA: hypothetical protein VGO85_06485 [Caldimonas sp.]|jgi:hypothetical protein|nr:hypothetical protein [Caldimonas sp.]
MGRFRFRSYVDDALFVVLIMAAAMAAAAMEASAVLGAFKAADHPQLATAAPSTAAPVAAAASSIDGAPVSVAAARIGRPAR